MMRTGELAQRAGVNIQTVRFYERKCLLREPSRTPSGYRCYTDEDVRQIRFIRECQDLGFTLQDIKQLIELHGFFSAPFKKGASELGRGDRMMRILQERLATIDGKLHALSRMRERLLAAVSESQLRQKPICPAQQQSRGGTRNR